MTLLEEREFVDLETLCRELGASESSVRRDLVRLEQTGVIKRVHGGAMAVQPRGHLLDYNWQRERQSDEKHRIGLRAASMIADDQTVILDGGSTVASVAEHLANRSLRVITNSLAIVRLFHDSRNIDVTLTGGFLFPRLEIVLGPLCEHMLAAVAADVLVMGIGGVTADGFSNNNTLVVGSERKMIDVSRKVIIVADSSKFGRPAMTPARAARHRRHRRLRRESRGRAPGDAGARGDRGGAGQPPATRPCRHARRCASPATSRRVTNRARSGRPSRASRRSIPASAAALRASITTSGANGAPPVAAPVVRIDTLMPMSATSITMPKPSIVGASQYPSGLRRMSAAPADDEGRQHDAEVEHLHGVRDQTGVDGALERRAGGQGRQDLGEP